MGVGKMGACPRQRHPPPSPCVPFPPQLPTPCKNHSPFAFFTSTLVLGAQITQQCCEAADHQAFRVLSVDYYLKALRLRYALQCKHTVVDTLVHVVSQLLVLHAVQVSTQQVCGVMCRVWL